METKQITVCDAIHIDVACEKNDWEDIKYGGSPILGYDFYISPDEDIEFIKNEIVKYIKKYNRPFISIKHSIRKNYIVEKLWTLEKIEECIKNNSI